MEDTNAVDANNSLTKIYKQKEQLALKLSNLVEEKQTQISDLSEKLSSEKDSNTRLMNTISNLEAKLSKYDDVCQHLNDELAQTKSRLASLDSKCNQYESQMSVMGQKHSEELKSLGHEKLYLLKQINSLNAEKEKHRSLVEELASKSGYFEKELENFKAILVGKLVSFKKQTVENLEKLKVIIGDHLKSVGRRVKSPDSGASEDSVFEALPADKKIETLLSAIGSLNFDLGKTITSLSHLLPEVVERERSASEEKLRDEFGNKEKALRSSNEFLKSSCEKLSLEMNRVNFQYDETKMKITSLEQQLLSYQQLTGSEKRRDEELQKYAGGLQNSRETNSRLQKALAENESLVDEYSTKIEFLEGQLNLKEIELKSAKKHIGDLKECIEKLQEIVRNRKESENTHSKMMVSLRSENDELRLSLEQLQSKVNKSCPEDLKSQSHIDTLRTAILNKEKLLERAILAEKSAQSSADNLTRELQKTKGMLDAKDNEITQLQEKLFNLTTANNLAISTARTRIQHACTQGNEDNAQFSLTQILCTSSEKTSPSHRLAQKYAALKLQLSLVEKRADILEKQKSHLREQLTTHAISPLKYSDQIEDLKEQIAAKDSFIRDLKNQLMKECTSNIEKLKEVEELTKYKDHVELSPSHAKIDLMTRFTEPSLEESIRTLTKHKWELLNDIFQQQRTFYERKNIHLGHFENFTKLVQQLRAKQNDSILVNAKIELELDIECLQNLNIFLRRFFIPLSLKECKCFQTDRFSDDAVSPTSVQPFTYGGEKDSAKTKPDGEITSQPSRPVTLHFERVSKRLSISDRLGSAVLMVSRKIDRFEKLYKILKNDIQSLNDDENFHEASVAKSPRKNNVLSLLVKLQNEWTTMQGLANQIFELNCNLKSLGLTEMSRIANKLDTSDRESVLSEDILVLSRSGSVSPASPMDDQFRKSSDQQPQRLSTTGAGFKLTTSLESLTQRSHFSSPDLGIESDANHESSAPESKHPTRKEVPVKAISVDSPLLAVVSLQQYKLLKKEIEESLVSIKGVLSRTTTGLQQCTKYSSPKKTVEYATFKAIRDTCEDIETCLLAANKVVDGFKVMSCFSEQHVNGLLLQIQELQETLKQMHESKKRQEIDFKKAVSRLKDAEARREEDEKKISKKLVQTKRVIRKLGSQMLQNEKPVVAPIPKYPVTQAETKRS